MSRPPSKIEDRAIDTGILLLVAGGVGFLTIPVWGDRQIGPVVKFSGASQALGTLLVGGGLAVRNARRSNQVTLDEPGG